MPEPTRTRLTGLRDLSDSALLPEGWDILTLGEMFSRRIEKGRRGLPVMSITMKDGLVERDSLDRRIDTNLAPEGHLLARAGDLAYNMMRMWQGVLGRAKFDCLVSPAYVVLQPNEKLEPEFAEYLLSTDSAIAKFKRMSYGVVDDRLRLYYHDLVRIPFRVPRSRVEQRRIANVLLAADEAIKQAEALIAKWQQIKAGLMHDLFTRGVTPDGRLRPSHREQPGIYKESAVGLIPRAWDVTKIRACGSVQLGRQRSPDKMGGKWRAPYLRVANVLDGVIDFSDVLEMDFTPAERSTFSIRPGDILLNEGQSLDLVGRCALYAGEPDAYCFQNTLIRFRCFDSQCPLFYAYLFKWFLDCGSFKSIAKQTTSVAHLGSERFAGMNCIRLSHEEQRRIADRLSAVQTLVDAESQQLDKLLAQKRGLLEDLLLGRVRVLDRVGDRS